MSRIDATMASARDDRLSGDLDVERHAVVALRVVDDEPRLADLRMPRDDRRDLRRMHEHSLHLGRLVGAPHPALDAQVGAAAGARARQHRGQIAGAEADQRIVGVEERRHDDFADLARRDRIAGAGAHDLDQHAFVDRPAPRAPRSRRRSCRGRPSRRPGSRRCRARAARRAALGGNASPDTSAFARLGERHAHFVGFVDDDLEERRRADEAAGVSRRSPAPAARSGRCRRETPCSPARARRSPASSPPA